MTRYEKGYLTKLAQYGFGENALGAGIGALGGAAIGAIGSKKNRLRNALLGALLGGGAGYGLSAFGNARLMNAYRAAAAREEAAKRQAWHNITDSALARRHRQDLADREKARQAWSDRVISAQERRNRQNASDAIDRARQQQLQSEGAKAERARIEGKTSGSRSNRMRGNAAMAVRDTADREKAQRAMMDARNRRAAIEKAERERKAIDAARQQQAQSEGALAERARIEGKTSGSRSDRRRGNAAVAVRDTADRERQAEIEAATRLANIKNDVQRRRAQQEALKRPPTYEAGTQWQRHQNAAAAAESAGSRPASSAMNPEVESWITPQWRKEVPDYSFLGDPMAAFKAQKEPPAVPFGTPSIRAAK